MKITMFFLNKNTLTKFGLTTKSNKSRFNFGERRCSPTKKSRPQFLQMASKFLLNCNPLALSLFLLVPLPRLRSLTVCCNPLRSPLLFHVPSFPNAWFPMSATALSHPSVSCPTDTFTTQQSCTCLLSLSKGSLRTPPTNLTSNTKDRWMRMNILQLNTCTNNLQPKLWPLQNRQQNDCDRLQSSAIGQPRINRTAPFSGAPCVRTRSSPRSFSCGQILWPNIIRRCHDNQNSDWSTCFHPCCLHLACFLSHRMTRCAVPSNDLLLAHEAPSHQRMAKNCLLTLCINKYLLTLKSRNYRSHVPNDKTERTFGCESSTQFRICSIMLPSANIPRQTVPNLPLLACLALSHRTLAPSLHSANIVQQYDSSPPWSKFRLLKKEKTLSH